MCDKFSGTDMVTWTSALTLSNHLSKSSLLACNLFHKTCPNPIKKLILCIFLVRENLCQVYLYPLLILSRGILTRLQTFPVVSWPVCKLFLWHLDPSANSSFGILTRLQTFPLASWIVCEIFLWHLALLHRFSGVWRYQLNCNILRNFFASKSWILQRLISNQRCIPL